MESLTLFLSNMYWIDTIIILALLCGYYILIQKKSGKILEKNTKYNMELLAMRTELYTEYEKNFFL